MSSPIRVHLVQIVYDITQHPPRCFDEVDTVLGVDEQDAGGTLSLVMLLARLE